MDIVKGSVVRATAGRDKDKFFVVLGREGDYALIADGKRRKVQKPKQQKADSPCADKHGLSGFTGNQSENQTDFTRIQRRLICQSRMSLK